MKYERRIVLPATAAEAFAWHTRRGVIERLNAPFNAVRLEDEEPTVELGASVTVQAPIGPIRMAWESKVTAFEKDRLLQETQEDGPMKKCVITHRFIDSANGESVLEEEVDYELPLGGIFGARYAQTGFARIFEYRQRVLFNDLKRHRAAQLSPQVVAITGATGLVGTALCSFLTTGGHTVRKLKHVGNSFDTKGIDGADVVIHLGAAGIADERWSPERKALIERSRVEGTKQIVEAIAHANKKPRALLSASAVGAYGDRGDELLPETAPIGRDGPNGAAFLSTVCRLWEETAEQAERHGVRTVRLRLGPVLTARGGALHKMLPPFQAGLGGPTGPGTQWMSWVSIEDVLGVVLHAMSNEALSGPINVVAPKPVTSGELASTLGAVLNRPAKVPVATFAVRALFGELADAVLLASQRAVPAVLQQSGFEFVHHTLEETLRSTLGFNSAEAYAELD